MWKNVFFVTWMVKCDSLGKQKNSKCLLTIGVFLLPRKDSNPHKRNQNPVCYHYTTRQSFSVNHCALACSCFWLTSAKLGIIFVMCKLFRFFFSLINLISSFFLFRCFSWGNNQCFYVNLTQKRNIRYIDWYERIKWLVDGTYSKWVRSIDNGHRA